MKYSRNTIIPSGKNEFILFWKPDNQYGCFSQWYMSDFVENGITYCCAEQYMMAQKAILMNDNVTLNMILNEKNPRVIKKLGRLVKNFDEQLWNKEKYNIVLNASLLKFSQNNQLKNILLSTSEKILVEASPYDTIWGIGMDSFNPNSIIINNWKGQNLLGFALMEARDILRDK